MNKDLVCFKAFREADAMNDEGSDWVSVLHVFSASTKKMRLFFKMEREEHKCFGVFL